MLKNKKFYFMLVLLFSVAINYAQNGNLTGIVSNHEGTPLQYAKVSILNTQKSTLTDFAGNYAIMNIPVGRYTIEATISGKTSQKEIEIEEGKTIEMNFLLDVPVQLDEIVVSASRTPEKLTEIPSSVSIVNSKQLKELTLNTSNINEILEFAVPGIAPSTGTFSNWGQTLRGRTALVLVDGIPQSTPLRNGAVDVKSVQPQDIERVEVVKGAGAIYGNGGDGGIINYITKKLDKNTHFAGNSGVWTNSNLVKTQGALGWGVRQSFNGSVNKFSYYVSGSFEQNGNRYDAHKKVISPIYGLDNTKILGLLGKVGYQITPNQDIELMFNHYRARQNSPFNIVRGSMKVQKSGEREIIPATGVPFTSNNPQKGVGVTTTNMFLKYSLRDIFKNSTDFNTDVYYQKGKNIFFYDYDYFKGGGQTVINSEKIGFRPIFSSKLYLELPATISLTYGVDFLKDRTNQGLLDGRVWAPYINLVSIAPFLQTTFKYNEGWLLKFGVRNDNMSASIDDFMTLSVKRKGSYTTPIKVKGGKLNFSNTAFNFGIRYIKHDEFIPYANFSQGFSLPDIGRVVRGASSTKVENLRPEAIKTNNYEFGFLSKFKHIKFELSGYYTTSNLGLTLKKLDGTEIFVQKKQPQYIYGADASIDFRFYNEKLQFGASYSYVEGMTHTSENPNILTYVTSDAISAPKTTVYVNVRPLDKWTASVRLVNVGNRNRFNPKEKSGVYYYSYAEAPVEGYTVVNLSSSYSFTKNLSVSLGINNLFNEYYLPARSQWGATNGTYISAGEGINGRFGVNYKF